MKQKFNIAVVGATGNVGREIIQILEQRNFPVGEIYFLASSRSKGKKISYLNKERIVEDLANFNFENVHIGLFSPGSKVSAEYAKKAVSKGCLVIDNTSYFRMNEEVPLNKYTSFMLLLKALSSISRFRIALPIPGTMPNKSFRFPIFLICLILIKDQT